MARATNSPTTRRPPGSTSKAPSRRETQKWAIRKAGGLQIVELSVLTKLKWLVHGFSTRAGGASLLDGKPALNLGFAEWDETRRVEENRKKYAAAISASKMPLATLRQIHSDVIHVAEAPPAEPRKADGLITNQKGLLLGVQTADCVPILLADTRLRVVAAVHAGWRGTLARIVLKALGQMRMQFGTRPRDVVAALGPAIGRCCYEVGPEVAQAFAAQFPAASEWFDGPFEQLAHGEEPLWLPWLTMMPPGHVPPPPRVKLDLRGSNRWQLMDAGVPEEQIHSSDLCTSCRTDLFFSYRREGPKTGRLMNTIGIR